MATHRQTETEPRVFELRTYVATPGSFDALLRRFRDHTVALFEKQGITSVGYWVPADAEGNGADTLIYLVAHASRAAAKQSWDAMRVDPEWIAAREASERGGRLTTSVTSVFLQPTDFSSLR